MTITNSEDVIDSRDIIDRIEELQEKRQPWAAGWNMPGYMPDSEPAAFSGWESARSYLRDEIERAAEETDNKEEAKALQETAERVDALNDGDEFGETTGTYHWWLTNLGADAGLDRDESEELAALEKLTEEASDYAADWDYGETLIRDSYFKEYAQQLADDIGAINPDARWPNNCIDWERAARELQSDYTAVDFDGVTYWVR